VQAHFKKIILATDFSDTSNEASYYALQLAHAFKAELIALHVFDTSAWNLPAQYYQKPGFERVVTGIEETRQRGKDALKELSESFDLEVETIFIEGHPGDEIVRVAEERNADLVILGTHGYSGWKRFSIGGVVEFVIKHAHCAVFAIRPREK
jgi:nucleotide-binding universal stress UspA family protein